MTSTVADDESVIEGLQRSLFHLNEEKNKASSKVRNIPEQIELRA